VSGPTRHELPAYFAAKLTQIGRESFGLLCEYICAASNAEVDKPPLCRELAFWFDLLATSEVSLSRGRKIHIRPLDAYVTALGGLTPADLKEIESETKSLLRKINGLKRSPFVRDLDQRGLIPVGDLLRRADFPCGSEFETLLKLRDLARDILGDPRRPKKRDFDSDLVRVYRFIYQHSGGAYYDERVADILNDLFPDRAKTKPFTQSSLKQWRYNRRQSITT